MTAGARRSARTPGKSDPIDASAVARAALREPDLPVAQPDGPARELRLLVDHRESLVRDRTAAQNRLRWRLHELEPGYNPPPGSLNRYKTLAVIDTLLDGYSGVVAELARREVTRIRELTREANQLERDIAARVTGLVPSLLAVPGCGALSAAKLVGEATDSTRFKSRDAYAMQTSVAPIPVWSANGSASTGAGTGKPTPPLHRIAITQARMHPNAQAFITRRLETGSTKREALRLLKPKPANLIYRTLQANTQQPALANAA